jgi:hypothetical protein
MLPGTTDRPRAARSWAEYLDRLYLRGFEPRLGGQLSAQGPEAGPESPAGWGGRGTACQSRHFGQVLSAIAFSEGQPELKSGHGLQDT